MSKRPTRFLLLQTDELGLLGLSYTLEEIGAAVLIWAWLSRGPNAEKSDAHYRQIANLSTVKWRRHGQAIRDIVDKLVSSSVPKHRFGRASLSKATRDRILERDGRKCRYCRSATGPFHIDHIKPLARGGSDRDENLCVACATCNFSKAANLVSEWNY